MSMRKHYLYLRYLISHKWHVMLACFRNGLYWQGIKHDWSKFLPDEWGPYAEYCYGKSGVWINGHRINSDYEDTINFRYARLRHVHRNPHHWEYWTETAPDSQFVDGQFTHRAMEIPRKHLLEMLCDWEGAGIARNGRDDSKEWYEKNRGKMLLHPETRAWIEGALGTSTRNEYLGAWRTLGVSGAPIYEDNRAEFWKARRVPLIKFSNDPHKNIQEATD